MRNVWHWTPRYALDRINSMIYQRRNPTRPWITAEANRLLETLLSPRDIMVEFGSGRSTLWFARKVARLISVEGDRTWFEQIEARIRAECLSNVDYLFREAGDPSFSAYVAVADTFANESVDVAVVDGHDRDQCAAAIMPKIVLGGLLIIDNCNWFLPVPSRSPNSCYATGRAYSPLWDDVFQRLRDWRMIWTSDGVWDTAIFVKRG